MNAEKILAGSLITLALVLAIVIAMPSYETKSYDLANEGVYVCRSEWGWFFTDKSTDCIKLRGGAVK